MSTCSREILNRFAIETGIVWRTVQGGLRQQAGNLGGAGPVRPGSESWAAGGVGIQTDGCAGERDTEGQGDIW